LTNVTATARRNSSLSSVLRDQITVMECSPTLFWNRLNLDQIVRLFFADCCWIIS